jgi:hypothetical protein
MRKKNYQGNGKRAAVPPLPSFRLLAVHSLRYVSSWLVHIICTVLLLLLCVLGQIFVRFAGTQHSLYNDVYLLRRVSRAGFYTRGLVDNDVPWVCRVPESGSAVRRPNSSRAGQRLFIHHLKLENRVFVSGERICCGWWVIRGLPDAPGLSYDVRGHWSSEKAKKARSVYQNLIFHFFFCLSVSLVACISQRSEELRLYIIV